MKTRIKIFQYITIAVLAICIVGYIAVQKQSSETSASITTLNTALIDLLQDREILDNPNSLLVLNKVAQQVLGESGEAIDLRKLSATDYDKVKKEMALELGSLQARMGSISYIKIAIVFIFAFSTGILIHNMKRSFYVNQLSDMESDLSKMSIALKEKEETIRRSIKQYSKIQHAYKKAQAREQELQGKIAQADAVQQEMKDFVDIQIQTNEQLLIAENKLKNLLEKEQEGKLKLEEAMDKLKDTQGQLVHSEKMASLGQLTAGIAHEINNPINFIYNGIESIKRSIIDLNQLLDKYELLEKGHDPEALKQDIVELKEELEYEDIREDLADMVSDIKDGAVRTIEIVKGLRVFSRLDEEHLKMANINECLDATLILLKNKTKNRIAVIKEYDENLPDILCYPGQLNQVFMNILNNAIQAIPDEQENAQIVVKTETLDKNLLVRLSDNGSGMSEEVKQRIFEPFFTTKPVGVGTGLGMSISYGIIEKHNGKLSVETALGQGTEFSISLPVVNEGIGVNFPDQLQKAV